MKEKATNPVKDFQSEERLRRRIVNDTDCFSDAFVNLSEVVAGSQLANLFSSLKAESSNRALSAVLNYYGVRTPADIPDTITDPMERLDYILQPEGISRRTVKLDKNWFRNAIGAFLTTLEDGTPVALIPGIKGYFMVNNVSGEKTRVTSRNADQLNRKAICFYAPLPAKPLDLRDLMQYALKNITIGDLARIGVYSLVVTLISLIGPRVMRYVYHDLAFQASLAPVLITLFFLFALTLSRSLMDIAKRVSLSVVETHCDAVLSNALMMRVLNLPASFFRDRPVGDLHSRINSAATLCSSALNFLYSCILSAAMSLIYLIQISQFASPLMIPSVIVAGILIVYAAVLIQVHTSVFRKKQEADAAESAFLFSMISGINKIHLAGAERRIFAKWAETCKPAAKLNYNPPFLIRYQPMITTGVTLLGTCIAFYEGWKHNIDTSTYLAFTASFGLLMGTLNSMISASAGIAVALPMRKMIQPILETVPETGNHKRVVSSLSGAVDLSKVSFRYEENMPNVINDFSLQVRPGEYVGITGRSGSGKSTLFRLLLGFEKPSQGSISYDRYDLSMVDPHSLRRHIGCVLQNSKLFTGTIRMNITLNAPEATDEEVWNAVRMAGLEEDIKALPMGLNTMIWEGTGGISGGQRQRLVIAQAIIAKPSILLFDEATSALDNYTQKIVTDALAGLHCTRIVIAHRLSTIRDCDRIIVMDQGRIVEEGNYEELMKKNGLFTELVRRQNL